MFRTTLFILSTTNFIIKFNKIYISIKNNSYNFNYYPKRQIPLNNLLFNAFAYASPLNPLYFLTFKKG